VVNTVTGVVTIPENVEIALFLGVDAEFENDPID